MICNITQKFFENVLALKCCIFNLHEMNKAININIQLLSSCLSTLASVFTYFSLTNQAYPNVHEEWSPLADRRSRSTEPHGMQWEQSRCTENMQCAAIAFLTLSLLGGVQGSCKIYKKEAEGYSVQRNDAGGKCKLHVCMWLPRGGWCITALLKWLCQSPRVSTVRWRVRISCITIDSVKPMLWPFNSIHVNDGT